MTASNIIRLGTGRTAILAAAQTTTRAFEADPLIRWLRPNRDSQLFGEDQSLRWQYRRLQSSQSEGFVFVQYSKSTTHETGAVGILIPGRRDLLFRIKRALPRLWVYLLNKLSPVVDTAADIKRVEVMMEAHEKALKLARRSSGKYVWYIEVVAVDPEYQGQGLGSQMLQHMIQQCPSSAAIFLECTQKVNVAFYSRFGFEVVQEEVLMALDSSQEEVKLWVMMRQ